ncbi:hypothetical protein ACFFRR_005156 [Megaselia abdita]
MKNALCHTNEFNHFSKVDLVMCGSMMEPPQPIGKVCSQICSMEYSPICGSDGNTFNVFGNKCEMEIAACEHSVTLKSVNMDFCKNTKPQVNLSEEIPQATHDKRPTENHHHHKHESHTKVSKLVDNAIGHGHIKNKKECPDACPFNFAPVCGKNGHKYKVFTNVCEMNRTKCTNTAFDETNMNFCKIYDSAYNTIMRE